MPEKIEETPEAPKPEPDFTLWLAPHWGKTNGLFENSMLNRETVVFRDGSSVTVYEENQYIAEYLIRLERDCKKNPAPEKLKQTFRACYYAKLLACSVGDVPNEEKVLVMPTIELQKWVDAVRKINPGFFVNLDKFVADELTEEEKKSEIGKPQQ
jgi:hypothetical protein